VDPARDHQRAPATEWFQVAQSVTIDWRGGVDRLVECERRCSSHRCRPGRCPPDRTADGTLFSWVNGTTTVNQHGASQQGRSSSVRFRPLADSIRWPRRDSAVSWHPALAARSLKDKGDSDPRLLPAEGTLFRAVLPENVEGDVFPGRLRAGVLVGSGLPAAGDRAVWHPRSVGRDGVRCTATEDPRSRLGTWPTVRSRWVSARTRWSHHARRLPRLKGAAMISTKRSCGRTNEEGSVRLPPGDRPDWSPRRRARRMAARAISGSCRRKPVQRSS